MGTPIANRNRAETEDLIGFFVNTLVLRTKVGDANTFRDLLEQVRESTVRAYDHQDVPFEKLVEELQPERNLSRQPLFQVMFALNDLEDLQLSELDLSWVHTELEIVKFDMTLTMVMGKDDFVGGNIRYSTDLFDAATIKRMVRHFELLLESLSIDPDQSLSELSFVTPAEQQMLAEWNDTKREYPDGCLHDLFEAQAARTPECRSAGV